jgi:crotonobetainyl-CoA hydratase
VTLNRPEVMNALHDEAHAELVDAFADFRADPDLWVGIITGAGDRAFCAGDDLKVAAQRRATGGRETRSLPFAGITWGFDCPKPLIAAVNGVALGGGFETALACDLVIASQTASFGLTEPRVGLFAAAGGVHRLARQVPLKQAMGLLLTGAVVSADEGYRLGFVTEVVPPDDLMASAERWAHDIQQCSPTGVQLTKEAALDGLRYPVGEAIRRDFAPGGRYERLIATADAEEGPRAFVEKRTPRWTGSWTRDVPRHRRAATRG